MKVDKWRSDSRHDFWNVDFSAKIDYTFSIGSDFPGQVFVKVALKVNCQLLIVIFCRHRLVVRTSGFHPGNRSSILRGGTITKLSEIFPIFSWAADKAAHCFFGEFSPFFNSSQTTFPPVRRRFASRAILKFCLVICFAQTQKEFLFSQKLCYTKFATNEPKAFLNSRLRNQSKSLGWSHRGRLFEFKKN